jgi:uncharacterized protein YaeQ
MALKSTIFKAELQIADMDRNHYATHQLTIARHPSETDLRMMARLLAFALNADDALQFTRGISTEDEPDLWQKNLSGEIDCWIYLGQPDEKRIRKACGRARHVIIYSYQQRSGQVWWQQLESTLQRFTNLTVYQLPEAAIQALTGMAQRNMQLQCTIQDGEAWFGDSENSLQIVPILWKSGV